MWVQSHVVHIRSIVTKCAELSDDFLPVQFYYVITYMKNTGWFMLSLRYDIL